MTETAATNEPLRAIAALIAERALGKGAEADALAAEIVGLAEASGTPYAAALAEINLLRALCAHESLCIEADTEYASFPKSRRAGAQERQENLARAARGEVQAVTAGMNLRPVRALVGVEPVTRASFEDALPRR
jgi:hypothetical protein